MTVTDDRATEGVTLRVGVAIPLPVLRLAWELEVRPVAGGL